MCKMKLSANCSHFIMSEQGTKCAILLSGSTITHNVLHLSTGGNPVMKFMDIESHGQSVTCSSFSSPNGAYLTGIILLHVSQWLTYRFIYCYWCGQ
jgi:hypothetical protein